MGFGKTRSWRRGERMDEGNESSGLAGGNNRTRGFESSPTNSRKLVVSPLTRQERGREELGPRSGI